MSQTKGNQLYVSHSSTQELSLTAKVKKFVWLPSHFEPVQKDDVSSVLHLNSILASVFYVYCIVVNCVTRKIIIGLIMRTSTRDVTPNAMC